MVRTILLLASLVLTLAGCSASRAYSPASAVCVLLGTEGYEEVHGEVRFTRQAGGVLVEATVHGLAPGDHGFHVHEFGDVACSDGTCTGGHFNPSGAAHGGPDDPVRHVGDLGNITADDAGVGRYRRVDELISLDFLDPACIIGRAIIVHADRDDLTSQPTGDAGARIAAGVVGVGEH